jgi:hypothetical protein
MVNWFEHPKYVPDTLKTLDAAEAAYALREAWKRIYGLYPSDKSLAVLWAKSCLETGRWKSIHNYNFGNIKRKINDNDNTFTMYECGEEISLDQAQKLVIEDPGLVTIVKTYSWSNSSRRASVKIKPGHQWSQFISYETVEDGAEFYIRFVSQNTRYKKAWQKVIEGDPEGYSHELKVSGYYTANEAVYTAGVVRLFNEFLKRKNELMSWKPEQNDTDPAPPPDIEPADTEIDNPIPEFDNLPDDSPDTIKDLDGYNLDDLYVDSIKPEVQEIELEDSQIETKFENKKKINGNQMTTIALVAAFFGGLVSWFLQSCQ